MFPFLPLVRHNSYTSALRGIKNGRNKATARHFFGILSSKRVRTISQLLHSSGARLINHSAPEHERLNLQTRDSNEMMHGKAFHTPVNQPSRVLEVGAGTGYVTRLLASTFPQAEVGGLDLSTVPVSEKTNAVFIQGCHGWGCCQRPFRFHLQPHARLRRHLRLACLYRSSMGPSCSR